MIIAMEGWLHSFKGISKRCWLVRSVLMLGALLCFSCGKKITDANQDKVKTNKRNISSQAETLEIPLNSSGNNLIGEHELIKRAFLTLPQRIMAQPAQVESAQVYFHVTEKDFEYYCQYINDPSSKYLLFDKCVDNENEVIEGLEPGEETHLPAGEEIYIEAQASDIDRAEISLDVIRK